ncbi:M23 family metallopeptidase [Streptomyces sp. ATexAB-D23]|uniref:M23 family metallopeptidase n=1 Tax=unclassified Streptomyces TaxID=2593676 RepID=UPI000378C505|nr:M23 family metallopeptidase [Streptomyces sp. ATexAB-D23]MYY04166.1 peptidoglycan DD-metalloendopeptidase family protein [Streptomyces sp. SID4913]
MNDQHPHAGYAGYDSHPTGSFDSDPLFGSLPGGSYEGSHDTAGGYGVPYTGGQAGYSGSYGTTQWDTGAHQAAEYNDFTGYPAYADQAQQHPQYDAPSPYDTGATWLPTQGYAPDSSGQWDTTAWNTASYDTGAYDATAWNTGATPEHAQQSMQNLAGSNEAEQAPLTDTYEAHGTYEAHETYGAHDTYDAHDTYGAHDTYETYEHSAYDPYEPYRIAESEDTADHPEADLEADLEARPDADPGTGPGGHPDLAPVDAHRPAGRPVPRSGGRSRRRSPAKRSALLTVAVPSACVMSVAGIAAASVGGMGGGETKKDDTTTMAAADPGTVEPVAANNELDTQLANLSADAENFADRASRTQERIDLKARQAAEKKKREEEAARKEALRPKFVMPVKEHGLSAYFGQAGVNWMSVHTGIDFPVQYGTPVMAATDGTVRTQYNSAYGNMAIVTMADGTETWYCHLSSTRIRSGQVKAGDVIAYSGSSGNSTGPHMHFEVRPGGGAAIDPLPWLRSHDVNPT